MQESGTQKNRSLSRGRSAIKKESVNFTDTLPEFGSGVVPRANKSAKPMMKGILMVVAIVLVGGLLGYFSTNYPFGQNESAGVYHAVFMSNGQTFFGTIGSENSDNIVLNNVYYIQLVDQELPPLEEGGEPRVIQQPQLFRKGDENYGPENSIRLNRNQVIAIEALRGDSQILTQIQADMEAR